MDSRTYNPVILTPEQLEVATTHDVIVAIYLLMFSVTALFFAVCVYIAVFKTAVWFLPKVWRAKGEKA